MPFGLTNTPTTFKKTMNLLLTGLPPEVAIVYINDIIYYNHTFEEELCALKLVVADTKLKTKKCAFMRHELLYLRYLILATDIMSQL